MGKYKYKFTLFTACYNSAPYIDRIKKSIDGQVYRDFEWIVINDASSDNTSELLREYIDTLDIPVKFFDLQKNQMLAANYNLAVENAEGEVFVLMGHDDIYLPNMLQIYNELYEKYNAGDDETIGGLVARCKTQYGVITPCEFSKPLMTYWEYGVDKKGNYTGEAPRAIKTDVLKKYMPFDPEEKLNPPIEEFMGCDGYKFITTNSIVREYYYANPGSLCFSVSKYRLHQWRTHLAYINKFQFYMPWPFKRKLRAALDYAYSSVKLNKSFCSAIKALEHDRFWVICCYPLAWCIGLMSDNKTLHGLMVKIASGHNPNKD